jgi:hypothetical protein
MRANKTLCFAGSVQHVGSGFGMEDLETAGNDCLLLVPFKQADDDPTCTLARY